MPDPLNFAKPSLAFAKLVSTPNETSWSQVYNAGNLFACLSLSVDIPDEKVSLHLVGKTIFNTLEAEFFTLEKKSLEGIRQAIQTSVQDAPAHIRVNLSLACFRDDVLYLFIYGQGRVVMKRNEKSGVLLDKTDDDRSILSASGFLKNEDVIILESRQFAKDISDEELNAALELALPNDIAETLSPQIHEKDDGGQAAIIIAYHGYTRPGAFEERVTEEEPEDVIQDRLENENEEDIEDEDEIVPGIPEEEMRRKYRTRRSLPHLPKMGFKPTLPRLSLSLNHRKKFFLSIAIILICLLVFSVFATKKKQEDSRTQAAFQTVYQPAQKNYEEGLSLKSLNKSLSRDDFLRARDLLKGNVGKFKKDSDEEKRLSALLKKVEEELGSTSETHSVSAKEASVPQYSLLGLEKSTQALAFAQDADDVYYVTSGAISSVNKSSGKKEEQIRNENDWETAKAICPYQGNIYVLDPKKGVLKYVAAAEGYSKSSYFNSAPDLTNAVSLAIDGSVYILFSDGNILKYTRGQAESFKLSGLDKPLSSPIKIFTDLETDSLYVLDKGNTRIVKLAKNGTFEAQYSAGVIRDAKDFEILESDKKALILSGGKTWEIKL